MSIIIQWVAIHVNPREWATAQAILKTQGMDTGGSGGSVWGLDFTLALLHAEATVTQVVQRQRLCGLLEGPDGTMEKWPAFSKNHVGTWLLCSFLRTFLSHICLLPPLFVTIWVDPGQRDLSAGFSWGNKAYMTCSLPTPRETQWTEQLCSFLKTYINSHSWE